MLRRPKPALVPVPVLDVEPAVPRGSSEDHPRPPGLWGLRRFRVRLAVSSRPTCGTSRRRSPLLPPALRPLEPPLAAASLPFERPRADCRLWRRLAPRPGQGSPPAGRYLFPFQELLRSELKKRVTTRSTWRTRWSRFPSVRPHVRLPRWASSPVWAALPAGVPVEGGVLGLLFSSECRQLPKPASLIISPAPDSAGAQGPPSPAPTA